MPLAPVITEDIIELVSKIYYSDKTQPAKQVLAEVHKALGRTDWPKLSVIQRELKKIRDIDKKINPPGLIGPESPWHLGLMANYPEVNAGAAHHIIRIQQLKRNKRYIVPRLTIRQALWINRLHQHIKKEVDLFAVSFIYSRHEIISELSNKTIFDTTKLDRELMKGVEALRDWERNQLITGEEGNFFNSYSRLVGFTSEEDK